MNKKIIILGILAFATVIILSFIFGNYMYNSKLEKMQLEQQAKLDNLTKNQLADIQNLNKNLSDKYNELEVDFKNYNLTNTTLNKTLGENKQLTQEEISRILNSTTNKSQEYLNNLKQAVSSSKHRRSGVFIDGNLMSG